MTRRYRVTAVSDGTPQRQPTADLAVSFIVPAFQARTTLGASIASIREAAPPGSEVVIIDDGSHDDTPTLAAGLADVLVLRPCQGGAARSRNDGVRAARGKVLVFVDSDVTVTAHAVRGLLAHITAGADAAFGAYEALPPEEIRNVATTYKNLLHHYTHSKAAGEAQTFWSGFGAVRRDAFLAVNGFDAAVSTGADVEDIHLGYRLRAAGYRIVLDPTLQVRHHKQYTVKGVVVSDVMHRAIPWTRAMLQTRTFDADLNVRRSAMVAAVGAWTAVLSIAAAPVIGRRTLPAAAAGAATWAVLNRDFLAYSRRAWGIRGEAASTGMLFLYSLYGPVGAGLGTAAHLLRSRQDARLNWLRLDHDDEAIGDDSPGPAPSDGAELAVTVALIASPGETIAGLAGLPDPAPWWELVVVSADDQPGLPAHARLLRAEGDHVTRDTMRQQALEVARGEMLVLLDAGWLPGPDWLTRVRTAAARADLAIGGSFDHDRRSPRHRANQVARYWSWRPERRPAWITNHPTTNMAVRTAVARTVGGFQQEGALLLRLAGFGARPLRFDPAMIVSYVGPAPSIAELVPGVGGTSRLRASASSRFFRMGVGSRVFFAALTPLSGAADAVGTVRTAVSEGTSDPTFWAALPVVLIARASHWLGRAVGLLRPEQRGGVVPRSVADLVGARQTSPEA